MKLLRAVIPLVMVGSAAAEHAQSVPHPYAVAPRYPVVTYAPPCAPQVVVPRAAWHPAPVVVIRRPAYRYRAYRPRYAYGSTYRPIHGACRPSYGYRRYATAPCYRAPRVVVDGSARGGCSPGHGW